MLSALYTALAGLLLLPLALRLAWPYLLRDLRFVLHSAWVARRARGYAGRSPPHTMVEIFEEQAARRPHKPLVLFREEAHSYGQVDKRSSQVARALRERVGLQPGDCLALFMGNEPAFLWVWLGSAKLGCTLACLNYNIRAKSLLHCFYSSGATVLLAAPGLPKAAVISHHRMLLACRMFLVTGVTSEDVVYISLPLYHSSALLLGVHGCIIKGATIALRFKFSASQFWDDCRKYNVTVIQYIGEVLRYLCNTPKKDNDGDHRVRSAIGNGLRADVWREFIRRFGDIHIFEFYASTEGNIGFINYTHKIGAVGRVTYFHKKMVPYELIRYDAEEDKPVRDENGYCIRVPKGEAGLLICKITPLSPFSGYAGEKSQTEKKKLTNVFQKGDIYFNSGDLLIVDKDNFIYFHDRVGDTFRWKGENVATNEVADILGLINSVQEVNVYGVPVPGHEGRIGMAAIQLKKGSEFNGEKTYRHVVNYLPSYAQPRFLRIQDAIEVTETFKHRKMQLVKEGFNSALIKDSLYFLDDKEKTYVPMTQDIYNAINNGSLKL